MKQIILAAILLLTFSQASNGSCCSVYEDGSYIYIVNHSNYWVDCYIGKYTFAVAPNSSSRSYPRANWGCS